MEELYFDLVSHVFAETESEHQRSATLKPLFSSLGTDSAVHSFNYGFGGVSEAQLTCHWQRGFPTHPGPRTSAAVLLLLEWLLQQPAQGSATQLIALMPGTFVTARFRSSKTGVTSRSVPSAGFACCFVNSFLPDSCVSTCQ